mgnify:FL=1
MSNFEELKEKVVRWAFERELLRKVEVEEL